MSTGKVLSKLYLQCHETLDNIFIEELKVTDIIIICFASLQMQGYWTWLYQSQNVKINQVLRSRCSK